MRESSSSSESSSGEVSIIYRVPESLRNRNPRAYTPWLIGMGPLHHHEPGLYKMEGFKLAVAKLGLQRFNIPDLKSFAGEVVKPLLPRMRACYDFPIGLFSPELEWVMAIDGLFFLELLCDADLHRRISSAAATGHYFFLRREEEGENLPAITAVLDDICKTLWPPTPAGGGVGEDDEEEEAVPPLHYMVLNDAVLLENQIPISIFAEALTRFRPDAGRVLAHGLDSVSAMISPIQFSIEEEGGRNSNTGLSLPAGGHLLEHLYRKISGCGQGGTSNSSDDDIEPAGVACIPVEDPDLDIYDEILRQIPDCLSMAQTKTGEDAASSAPFRQLFKKLLAGGLKLLAVICKAVFRVLDFCMLYHSLYNKLATTISVPSATALTNTGIRFKARATTGDLRVEFDEQNKTIELPVLRWHPYCEVVIRNLIIYEAAVNNVMPLTQYIHFMHMITRSQQDVQTLIETGVVVGTSTSSADKPRVLQLFSSLCTCSSAGCGDRLLDDSSRRRFDRCTNSNVNEAVDRYYNGSGQAVLIRLLMRFAGVMLLVVGFLLSVMAVLYVAGIVCGFVVDRYSTECLVEGSVCYVPNITMMVSDDVHGFQSSSHLG